MKRNAFVLFYEDEDAAGEENLGTGGDGEPTPPPPCDENHPDWPDC